MSWYILTTAPQREFKASKALDDLGLRAVVPYAIRHRKGRAKGNKPVMIPFRVPLLPGYIFAAPAHDDMPWYAIKALPDVRGRVAFDGQPALLSDAEVDRMRRLAETERKEVYRGLKVGDKVDIMDGPFSGLDATLEAIGHAKVKVTVQIFGRSTSAVMRPDQVARAA